MFNFKKNTHKKIAIPVYHPSNTLERYIQDISYEYEQKWLDAYHCKLAARALSGLTIFHDWLDDENLLKNRISYIFNPVISKPKDVMVFTTYPLFLRDILENERIDNYLHSPITFVSVPMSYWLFRYRPIHVHIDTSKLRKDNIQMNFIDIGGLTIIDLYDIDLYHKAINKIMSYSSDSRVHNMVSKILSQLNMKKIAATEKKRDIFYMDEADRPLRAGQKVFDKFTKRKAKVLESVPGEKGNIKIEYDFDDREPNVIDITKMEFDKNFIPIEI